MAAANPAYGRPVFGIQRGIHAGIAGGGGGGGFGPSSIYPRALLHCDYTRSVIQPRYTTSASVTDRGVAAPDSVITFDQPSGSFLDGVGSVDLALTGSWLRQQVALGLYDGLDHVSTQCAESASTTDRADAASTATYDLTTSGIFAFSYQFRVFPTASNYPIIRKIQAGNNGYSVYVTSVGGLQLRVGDGVVLKTATISALNYADGAPHRIVVVIDLDAGTATIWSETGDTATADISALGTIASTGPFGIGFQSGVINSRRGLQPIDLIVWSANAGQIDATTNAKLQAHGGDPGRTKLTTKTHGAWHDSLGTDPGGSIVGSFSEDTHLPIGMGASQLGLHADPAVKNYCPESDDLTAWTASNATATANDRDSPRLFREAGKVTQTAAGGYRKISATGLVAATEYTLSLQLETTGAQSVLVEARDTANSALLTGSTFASTAARSRFDFQFTTAAGETAAVLRFYAGTAATSAASAWASQINVHLGAVPLRHVPTAGAAVTSAKSDYRVTSLVAGTHSLAARGEVEVVWSHDVNSVGSQQYITDIYAPSTNANRRIHRVSARKIDLIPYSSAAAAQGTASSAIITDSSLEHTTRARWSASTALDTGVYSDVLLDGVQSDGDVDGWTATETATLHPIGQDKNGGLQLKGHINRFRIFDRPRRQTL